MKLKAISGMIALLLIVSGLMVIIPMEKNASAIPGATILFNTGTNNSTMTSVIADGYTTWAFPENTFFNHVDFTIAIGSEAYYSFKLWVGDLGTEQTTDDRVMFKIAETGLIVGNQVFNSTASGNASSFLGLSQYVEIGQARLTPGSYTLQVFNMRNEAVASENYLGVRIDSISIEVLYPYVEQLSFAVITDTHYMLGGSDSIGVDGNIALFSHSPQLGRAFVDQINTMASPPDFVVILGDLMNQVAPGYYTYQKNDLDNLTMSYYPILGNHDHMDVSQTAALTALYNSTFPEFDTRFYYYRDISSKFRLIFLDSGYADGDGYQDEFNSISVAQKAFLNSSLNTVLPVFVFIHAPLIPGLSWDWLGEYSDINQILQAHSNVVSVFQGHGHNEWIRQSCGMLYVEAPAIIQYPFVYTTFSYYGGSRIDVNRVQLKNSTFMPADLYASNNITNTTKGLGETPDIQFMGFGSPSDVPLAVLMGVGWAQMLVLMLALGILVSVVVGTVVEIKKREMTPKEALNQLIRSAIFIIVAIGLLGFVTAILWAPP